MDKYGNISAGTSTGGMTSHAAVVARGMGKPCVAGCKDVLISGKKATIDKLIVKEGDWITIDGGSGEVLIGFYLLFHTPSLIFLIFAKSVHF